MTKEIVESAIKRYNITYLKKKELKMKTQNEIIEELAKETINQFGALRISLSINDIDALFSLVESALSNKFEDELNNDYEFLENSKYYKFTSLDELIQDIAFFIFNMDKKDFYNDKIDIKFENIFYSVFDEKRNYNCFDDDCDIFTEFVHKLNKNDETVNVWHIEQNLLKNYNNDKETIKELCYSYYLENGNC